MVLLLVMMLVMLGRGGYLVVIFVFGLGLRIVGELLELVGSHGGVSAGAAVSVPLEASCGLRHLVWAASRRWSASASGTHGVIEEDAASFAMVDGEGALASRR